MYASVLIFQWILHLSLSITSGPSPSLRVWVVLHFELRGNQNSFDACDRLYKSWPLLEVWTALFHITSLGVSLKSGANFYRFHTRQWPPPTPTPSLLLVILKETTHIRKAIFYQGIEVKTRVDHVAWKYLHHLLLLFIPVFPVCEAHLFRHYKSGPDLWFQLMIFVLLSHCYTVKKGICPEPSSMDKQFN